MKATINRLEELLEYGFEYISKASDSEMSHKPDPKKWSKKEILGHLIDSGINNLQRFTEIQFDDKPYKIRKYNQDELVKANDYLNSELKEVLAFWISINNWIIYLMKQQTNKTLNYKIELDKGDTADLRFLMRDYVDHLAYHLNQIKNSSV